MRKSYTLKKLAELTESHLVGDPHYVIHSFADLASAKKGQISFFAQPKYSRKSYEKAFEATEAGAIFIAPNTPLSKQHNFLIHQNPALAFQQVVELFSTTQPKHSAFKGIHSTALIHESCQIGNDVTIGPYTIIDQAVTIDEGTTIGPHCYIGAGTTIGQHCTLHAHVTIRERCTLHNRITIQPGTVIGSCGFGYTTNEKGAHNHIKHLGTVVIEDDVDIGANTTVDRSRFHETRIQRGTKIDNLVQIGHGVHLGTHNLIVSQTGIAGSVKTGTHVVMGGQVAVKEDVTLADGVLITGRSGISKSLTTPGKYGGGPAISLAEHNRNRVNLNRVAKHYPKIDSLIRSLQERIAHLEQQLQELNQSSQQLLTRRSSAPAAEPAQPKP